MAVNKVVQSNGTTLIDITPTTAVASDVVSGKIFFLTDGTQATGTRPSGVESSWTKVGEKTYNINTTDTSTQTAGSITTGRSDLWTSDKLVYVRIRDTAGKRDGYFYGSDQIFYNVNPVNGTTANSITTAIRFFAKYSNGTFDASTGSYGVWADALYPNGSVRVRYRYHADFSLTVNGTFKVEIYILDSPDGASVFG